MLFKKRNKFNKLGIKTGLIFSKCGLSPNHWTIISLLLVIISFTFLLYQNLFLGAIFFIAAGFIDIIDGAVARATKKVTNKGAYLDTVIDRYVEGILLLGILFLSLPSFIFPFYIWIFLYFFGSMMTTYMKAAAKEKDIANDVKGGILERAERLILIFIGLILGIQNPLYLTYILAVLAVLVHISAIQRFHIAYTSPKRKSI